jgi:ABC-type Fe3+/spermidine/putrescine transport system ATPase subunit
VARPESVELEAKDPSALTGVVRELVYLGSQMVYEVEIEGELFTVKVANPQEHRAFPRGEEVSLRFKEKSLHLLPLD